MKVFPSCIRLLLLFVLFDAAGPGAADTRTHSGSLSEARLDPGGLIFRSDLLLPFQFRHGTLLVPLSVENLTDRPRSLRLSLSPGAAPCAEVARDLELAPHGKLTLKLNMPLKGETYGDLSRFLITVTERGQNPRSCLLRDAGQSTRFASPLATSFEPVAPQLLLSRHLSAENLAKALSREMLPLEPSAKTSRRVVTKEAGYDCVTLACEAPAWPDDYRLYTPFDAVLIAQRDFAELSASVRDALAAYGRLGGAVLVLPDVPPTQLPFAKRKALRDEITASNRRLAKDLAFNSNYTVYNVKDLARIPLAVQKSIPFPLIVLLLGTFVFLAIPLTVWRCHKTNRRLHQLFILPLVSLVITICIAAGIALRYGFTPSLRVQSVTFLDQPHRLATTFGQVGIFSPVALDGEIAFPPDVSFIRRGNGVPDSSCSVFDGATRRLLGDWVKPLTPTFFDTEWTGTRSERLAFTQNPSGQLVLVNLLGAPVRQVRARLGNRLYTCGNLAPGATATLDGKAFSFSRAATTNRVAELLVNSTVYLRDSAQIHRQVLDCPVLIPEGGYVAELDGSPFLPSPLGKRKAKGSQTAVVIGTFDLEGKEAVK